MVLELSNLGVLKVLMESYVRNILQELQKKFKFLMVMMADALALGVNCINWWVDASYVVHPNLKSQTDRAM